MRNRLLYVGMLAVAAAVVLPFSASATSKTWAGSPYVRADCALTVDHGSPLLNCGKWVVTVEQTTQTIFVADESCAAGIRAVERRGTLETRFFRFDLYAGPVPLQKFNIAGNEGSPTETWVDFTDTDLGCV
jgi:hypothetical protein